MSNLRDILEAVHTEGSMCTPPMSDCPSMTVEEAQTKLLAWRDKAVKEAYKQGLVDAGIIKEWNIASKRLDKSIKELSDE